MLPGEQETRRELRDQYAHDFRLAHDILELAHQAVDGLCRDEPRRFGRLVKAVSVGAFARLCNQYRSIHALCELGLTQDAWILVRTMFEVLLRLEFLLCKKPPVLVPCKGLPAPKERLTVNFRAKLYAAEVAIQRDKYARMLKDNPILQSQGHQLQRYSCQRLSEVAKVVGGHWIECLKKGTMFGLSVQAMAGKLGYQHWYDAVYRFESLPVHGCDFEQFLAADEQGVITPTLYPDSETTTLPMRMAGELVLAATELASERFRLSYGQRIAELRDCVQKHLK